MNRIYTEIRINHKTEEKKVEYEQKFDQALKREGYKSRNEFVREKIRELINTSEGGRTVYIDNGDKQPIPHYIPKEALDEMVNAIKEDIRKVKGERK